MSGLNYVGLPPSQPGDIATRGAVTTIVGALTPNTASVTAEINSLVSTTYATKVYVDSRDATFVLPSYYQGQDALNIPTSAQGAPNGVAALDSTAKVPLTQVPNLGQGYVLGPFGTTATSSGTTNATPLKIADWNLGVQNLAFRPMVFLSAFVSSVWGQPIIEIRIADSTTPPAYINTTLVSQGVGRYLYNDFHAVVAIPAPDTTGQTPSNLPSTTNIWLSAWLYDLNNKSVTLASGNIASAAAFLVRGSQ